MFPKRCPLKFRAGIPKIEVMCQQCKERREWKLYAAMGKGFRHFQVKTPRSIIQSNPMIISVAVLVLCGLLMFLCGDSTNGPPKQSHSSLP